MRRLSRAVRQLISIFWIRVSRETSAHRGRQRGWWPPPRGTPVQGSPGLPGRRGGRENPPAVSFWEWSRGRGVGEGVESGNPEGISGGEHMLLDKLFIWIRHVGEVLHPEAQIYSISVSDVHLLSGDDVVSFSLPNSGPMIMSFQFKGQNLVLRSRNILFQLFWKIFGSFSIAPGPFWTGPGHHGLLGFCLLPRKKPDESFTFF